MNRKSIWRLAGIFAFLTALAMVASGCKSPSGSREYIPGKGWRSTQPPASVPALEPPG